MALRGTTNRLQQSQYAAASTLSAQATQLPLNELPMWVRSAICEAADELDVDAVDLATIFTIYHRASQTNHTETYTPNFERPSEAVYRGFGIAGEAECA